MESRSPLDAGKDGYDADLEFDERTDRALGARGRDDRLFFRDAVEVESFVLTDYQVVAPVLARMRRYRLLDLGCGYGRLAPLVSAFDCSEYLGVDRVLKRVEYARMRYGGGMLHFEHADALGYRTARRFDAVWTSNVLQHLLGKDKLRLVETAKLARAPGGVVLMREAEVIAGPREDLERRYAAADHARHMVPVPFAELAGAFEPLRLRRLGGIVLAASED